MVYVRAEIYVESHVAEKDRHRQAGRADQAIGTEARAALEEYYAKKVFLDLFVKIVPGWRNSPQVIREIFD